MKVNIYALRDKKAGYFNRLDLFENDFIALREYTLMLESRRMDLKDYDVLHLGRVDTTSDLPLIEGGSLVLVDIEKTAESIEARLKKFREMVNA